MRNLIITIYALFLMSCSDHSDGYFDSLDRALKYGRNLGWVRLDLERKNLDNIPLEVLEIRGIGSLNLSGNDITTENVNNFPFSSLLNLEVLDLSNNKLTKFPKSLNGCGKINFINVSYNPLKEIDYSILTDSLKTLDISHTEINNIDLNKDCFQSLEDLYAGGLLDLEIISNRTIPSLHKVVFDDSEIILENLINLVNNAPNLVEVKLLGMHIDDSTYLKLKEINSDLYIRRVVTEGSDLDE